jgi:hypothetical protein
VLMKRGFSPREKLGIERSSRLSAPANPTSSAHRISFFSPCRQKFAVPRLKALPVLRLELVAIGRLKADTIRRGRQGLHGENNFASVNHNQLPDVAV